MVKKVGGSTPHHKPAPKAEAPKKAASSVPLFANGTRIIENTDGKVTKWRQQPNGQFKEEKTGEIKPYDKLFPKGLKLDVTGDGKYDQNDFKKFQQLEVKGRLGETLEKSLAHNNKFFIRYAPPGIGGPEEASTCTGNLSFKATRNDDTFGGNNYTIVLPKKK
jgi:hypothetical protein